MLEVKTKSEVESRCGIECSKCHFRLEEVCQGCLNISHPFWEILVLLRNARRTKK